MRSIIYKLMFDFVKLVINDDGFVKDLRTNELLNFQTDIGVDTGEIGDVLTSQYHDLRFTISPSKRVEIKGSLHKFRNLGIHNYDDFGILAVKETIANLQQMFNLNPFSARISNLEVGLNIVTPFNPKLLIESLIAYKNKSFNKMKMYGVGFGKCVEFDQYEIKVYDKGCQYSLPVNLLRVEKKFTRMACLSESPVYLSHLADVTFAEHCLNILSETFDGLIIAERVNKKLLTKNEQRIYEKGSNPLYWELIKKNNRYRSKQQFTEVIQKGNILNVKSDTQDLLVRKRNELLITVF